MIDVTAKGFGVIPLKTFQSERDQRTRPKQSGFRAGRSCKDLMHNLRWTLEQRCSFQQATVMCFVDFASAFDSVNNGVKYRCVQRAGSTRLWCDRFCSTVATDRQKDADGQTASAAFYTRDAEIVCQRQTCGAASASLAYRRNSTKEDFVGLVTVIDVPRDQGHPLAHTS